MKKYSIVYLFAFLLSISLSAQGPFLANSSEKVSSFAFSDLPTLPEIPLYGSDSRPSDTIVIEGKIGRALLKTSNGCGVGNYMIPSIGDLGQGYGPVLGALKWGNFGNWEYDVIDSLPGTEILGVAFTREMWTGNNSIISPGMQNPYIVVTDEGLYSYFIQYTFDPYNSGDVFTQTSTPMLGISKMATQITTTMTNPICLYVQDSANSYSIRVHSYPDTQELFRFPFHFEPEVFAVNDDGLYITGWDTNGVYSLYHYNTVAFGLLGTYPLNDSASNAQQFLQLGDSLCLLSSPGDSMTTYTLIDTTGALTQSVVYGASGARATYNDYQGDPKFSFQPTFDPNNGYLEEHILIYDPTAAQTDTFLTHLALEYFKYAKEEWAGFGVFNLSWLGASWNGTNADTCYFAEFGVPFSVVAGARPKYINASYGCWVSTLDETEKIDFKVSPNPTTDQVTVHLIGLERGKDYQLDIIDLSGRLQHRTQLQAYQKLYLPLENLAKGTYILKLNTGQNVLTKKLILR